VAFVAYILAAEAQQYFSDQTYEYPLIPGVATNPLLTPIAQIRTPAIDLDPLHDRRGTLDLLTRVGVL